jgi:hypothetical protein
MSHNATAASTVHAVIQVCGRRRSAFLMRTHAFVCMLLSPMIVNLVGDSSPSRARSLSKCRYGCMHARERWVLDKQFSIPTTQFFVLFWNFTQPAHGNYMHNIRVVWICDLISLRSSLLFWLCACVHILGWALWMRRRENWQRHCS